MDGVIGPGERLTSAEFASRIKSKYPVYADLTDDDLVERTLAKYPDFAPFIIDRDSPAISEDA
jgi:hypothetical protein